MDARLSASLERAIQAAPRLTARRPRDAQNPHRRAIEVSAGSADSRIMRMLLLAPALAAATVAAASPPLTHAQLVTRANAICVRYDALLAAPPGVSGRLGDADFHAAWLRLFARQRDELARLAPPSTDTAAYARFLATLPPIATAFRKLATALETEVPVKRWRPLFRRFRAAERAAGQRARAVGIRRCFPQRGSALARTG
jgi:hypothetical protein